MQELNLLVGALITIISVVSALQHDIKLKEIEVTKLDTVAKSLSDSITTGTQNPL